MLDSWDLPPVEERLPVAEDIMVIKPWDSIGKYGGTLLTATWWPEAGNVQLYFAVDAPVKWKADLTGYEPALVESYEFSEDGHTFTMHMREGLKWSDGKPWTVDDILYWWETMVGGNGKEKEFPSGLKPFETPPDEGRSGKGSLANFNKLDDYTLELVFDAPAPLTAALSRASAPDSDL